MLLKQRLKMYVMLVGIVVSIGWFTASYIARSTTPLRLSRSKANPPRHSTDPFPWPHTGGTVLHTQAVHSPESQNRPQERRLHSQVMRSATGPAIAIARSPPPNTTLERHMVHINMQHLPQANTQEQDRFPIREHLTLPVPLVTLPVAKLLETQWMGDLKAILASMPPGSRGPISIASSDYKYRDILLNWLISAKIKAEPPLTHVIVLCLDPALHNLLQERGINSIYAPADDYLTQAQIKDLKKHIAFTEVQVLRLTVMRLLNHWGFDAANYDTDALIVKNPEALYARFNESDLIGSYGHHPGEIRAKWGVTVCCGMFMVRSTPQTETLWRAMSKVLPKSYNDQSRLNNALYQLGPDWGDSKEHNIINREWVGRTRDGLRVTILPGKHVCRQGCSRKHRDMYYVWHKGGSGRDGKISTARQGRLWFLREDWEEVTNRNRARGAEWLRTITMG